MSQAQWAKNGYRGHATRYVGVQSDHVQDENCQVIVRWISKHLPGYHILLFAWFGRGCMQACVVREISTFDEGIRQKICSCILRSIARRGCI